MRARAALMLLLALLPLPAAFADKPATDARKATAHRVVRVSAADARQPAEVSVAINPTDPRHVVAVSHQDARPGRVASNYVYASEDGGLTWRTVAGANPRQHNQGDDAIAFDADGTAYRTWIAFDGIRVERPRRAATGIFLASSRDGVAWTTPVPVVDHVNSVEPFEDKPWLGIDTSAESPHRGNVYVAWTRFDVYGSKNPEHKSHILFSRSRDGGRNFSPPLRISDKSGTALDDSTTVEGAVPAVGPKGEVYVVWAGPEGLVLDKSADGGATFGKDKVISENPPGWDFPSKGLPRHNGLPVTCTDLSRGPNRGSVYVCWTDKRNGDADVFVMASRDGGTTWGEPVRVNDDPKGNGKDQLFAWMAVDRRDGSLNVIFYDRRGLEGTKTGLTLARSVDGGKTFVNHRVDQEPFECDGGVFFGDYIGVAAEGGRVVATYMHFVGKKKLAISAALFRFKPGTQAAATDEE